MIKLDDFLISCEVNDILRYFGINIQRGKNHKCVTSLVIFILSSRNTLNYMHFLPNKLKPNVQLAYLQKLERCQRVYSIAQTKSDKINKNCRIL